MKTLLFLILLFFSFPLLAEVCETKDFSECINKNGKIECDKNIYWNIVKDKLGFYGALADPPIAIIELNKIITSSVPYNVCGGRKCQGKVTFTTFEKYKEHYYPRDGGGWYRYDENNNKYDIYTPIKFSNYSPRKFLYIKGDSFELTESFELKPPNITINRTSLGICYD